MAEIREGDTSTICRRNGQTYQIISFSGGFDRCEVCAADYLSALCLSFPPCDECYYVAMPDVPDPNPL